jgi:hypothetical protein
MKKCIVSVLFLFTILSLSAQTKITKDGVVGRWGISAVEMTGMFYYSLDKDSLSIGEVLKSQVKDAEQLASVTAAIRPELASISKMTFLFNADGTAVLGAGTSVTQSANYRIDEINSTIITTDKDLQEETNKAGMLLDKLQITLKQTQGDVLMTLKKVKTETTLLRGTK